MHKGIKSIQTVNTHLSSVDYMLVVRKVVKRQTAKNGSTLFLPQNVFYLYQKCPQWTFKYILNRLNVFDWGIMLPGLSEVSLTANMPRWLLTTSMNSVQECSQHVTWSDLCPSNLTCAMTNPETRVLHCTSWPVSQNKTKLKEEAKHL
jgi:hypothetical protein